MSFFNFNCRRRRGLIQVLSLVPTLVASFANAASVPPPGGLNGPPSVITSSGRVLERPSLDALALYPDAAPPGLSFPVMQHLFQAGDTALSPTALPRARLADSGFGADGAPSDGKAPATNRREDRRDRENSSTADAAGADPRQSRTHTPIAGHGAVADIRPQSGPQSWIARELPPRFSAILWLIGTGMIGLAVVARRRSHIDDRSQVS